MRPWPSVRRRLRSALLTVMVVAGAARPARASASAPDPDPELHARPRIGLVLSGGGARGAAHVGVLKVLHELGVRVDYVVGTSMGSIVGGLYASGMSADEIEQALLAQDWKGTFQDLPDRPLRPFRRKSDDRLYLVPFKPGFNHGRLELPIAALQGQNFDLTLNRLTLGVAAVSDFDALSIPYRAVATDIVTGEPVVLGRGSVARAMRASLAVPGVFAPVEIDGRLLVDGGVSSNLPVDVARQMGAERLIVVNISTGLSSREELGSALGIVSQLTTLLTYRDTARQLETLEPEDILIAPDLGDITSSAFDRIGEAIPIGAAAARVHAVRLKALSPPPSELARPPASAGQEAPPPPTIDFIRIDNRSRLADAVIRARLRQRVGERLDVARLERDVGELYALEVFESVRYDVVREAGRTGLVLHAVDKSWGPNFVQFGLKLSTDLGADAESRFDVAIGYTRAELDRLNGEARVAVQIGERPAVILDAYQPLDPASRWFVFGQVGARQRSLDLFEADAVASEYRLRELGGEAGAGRNLGGLGEVRLGYRRDRGDADVRVSRVGAEDFRFDRAELHGRLTLDTIDRVEFPRRGRLAQLEWLASRRFLGADADFDQLLLSFTEPFSWGRNTVMGTVSLQATVAGDAPIQNLFTAGGFLRLSGLKQDELAGQHLTLARVIYSRLLRDRVHLGASAELGNVWQDMGDIGLDGSILAGAAFLGVDTPIGPFYAGYGLAEGGRHDAYLFLGLPY